MTEPVQGQTVIPIAIEGTGRPQSMDVSPNRRIGDLAADPRVIAAVKARERRPGALYELFFPNQLSAINPELTVAEANVQAGAVLGIAEKLPALPSPEAAFQAKTLYVVSKNVSWLKGNAPNLASVPYTDEQRNAHRQSILQPKPRRNWRILVWSLKGGAGKTTLSIALGGRLAEVLGLNAGYIVLVDADKKGTMTTTLADGDERTIDRFVERLGMNLSTDELMQDLPKTLRGVRLVAKSQQSTLFGSSSAEAFKKAFGGLDRHASVTIIEASIDPDNPVTGVAVESADFVIFVANPREAEMEQIQQATSYLASINKRYAVAMNQVDTRIDLVSASEVSDREFVIKMPKKNPDTGKYIMDPTTREISTAPKDFKTILLPKCSGLVTFPDDHAAAEKIVGPWFSFKDSEIPESFAFPLDGMCALVTRDWSKVYQVDARAQAKRELARAQPQTTEPSLNP